MLCLARAASEFGARLKFVGSFAGWTQTISLAIMAAFESDLAAALAVLLLGLSTAALVLVHTLVGSQISKAGRLAPQGRPRTALNTRAVLMPPNPNEFDSTTRSRAGRPCCGT